MNAPVLFYDGVCNFCNASVRFVVRHERSPVMRFAALQSPTAATLLTPYGIAPGELSSMLVLENGRLYRESDALIAVARHLRPPWCWFGALRRTPKGLRDAVYRAVGARRYRWWGRRPQHAACSIVDRVPAHRFLP